MSKDHQQSLFQGYFDNSLDQGEKQELEELLLSSPEARESFSRMARIHGILSFAGEMGKGSSAASSDSVVPFSPARRQSAESSSRPKILRWIAVGLASAACIVITGSLFQMAPSPETGPITGIAKPGLAQITSSGLVEWSPGSKKTRGLNIDAGLYEIKFGSLRLQMGGGASVSIAAPCQFEIVSGKRIDVRFGKLTARLPNDEDELVITMPGLTLTDLGTGFGVDVGSTGEALVSVFEGKVRLDGQEGSSSTILKAGNSITHDPESGSEVKPLKFQSSQFTDLWPLTLGIDEASSLITFLPPGPKYPPLEFYTDADHLFLVPEKQTIVLKQPLLLDLGKNYATWPNTSNPLARERLPQGKKVSSYLVFYNPPLSDEPLEVQSLSGELTFNREIAGVICSRRTLVPSEGVLGVEDLYFEPLMQPSEAKDTMEGILPHDSFRLSSDRRSISFKLNVTRGIDSFRIILSDS